MGDGFNNKFLIASMLSGCRNLTKIRTVIAVSIMVIALPNPSRAIIVKNWENDFKITNSEKVLQFEAFADNPEQDTCPAIIPLPNKYSLLEVNRSQFFYLKANTPIILDKDAAKIIKPRLRKQWQTLLKSNIQRLLDLDLDFSFNENRNQSLNESIPSIILNLARPGDKLISDAVIATKTGSYRLSISPNRVVITANDQSGFLYGLISLMQLGIHENINNQGSMLNSAKLRIPCWQIQDQPNYEWRGLMLDESRHFFGKAEVEKLLTWMAYYKLNRFHWHLTDEPAWRIQMNAYPKLTTVGAIGNKTDSTAPAKFYTQAEIKEVICYAKALGITVIPEIDMPGHATAANRAYPENSGGGVGQFANFTFNPGRDSTYMFLTNILREVQGLFKTKMVHLGGDEVSFGNGSWGQLPAVKSLMASQHLKDNKEVEAYFLRRMADSALQFNDKILTWDEGVDAGLDANKTIIFWWRHDKIGALKHAIEKGYDVVMCPRIPLYFDFVQDSAHKVGRKWAGKYASLQQVFDFYPASYTINMESKGKVLGLQANLWTETVHTVQRLDYMLFPRMAALAAAAWTKKTVRQIDHFENTLEAELYLYNKTGIDYYNPFDPARTPEVKK